MSGAGEAVVLRERLPAGVVTLAAVPAMQVRLQGPGFRVQGSGCRVQGSVPRFRVRDALLPSEEGTT
jgi:hypothetical protein